jgi:uncharacterized protein YjbI with pentapeptide repeats
MGQQDEQRIAYRSFDRKTNPVVGQVVEYDKKTVTLNSDGMILKLARAQGMIEFLPPEQEQKVKNQKLFLKKLRKMDQHQLDKVIKSHKRWLTDTKYGEQANLCGTDLSGADLSGADLRGAYLSKADMSKANLNGADLSGADLSKANLSGASLCGANLYRANMIGANLNGVDLYRICSPLPATADVNLYEQRIAYRSFDRKTKPVVGQVVEYDKKTITLNSSGMLLKLSRAQGMIEFLPPEQEQKVKVEQEQTKSKERSGIER